MKIPPYPPQQLCQIVICQVGQVVGQVNLSWVDLLPDPPQMSFGSFPLSLCFLERSIPLVFFSFTESCDMGLSGTLLEVVGSV